LGRGGLLLNCPVFAVLVPRCFLLQSLLASHLEELDGVFYPQYAGVSVDVLVGFFLVSHLDCCPDVVGERLRCVDRPHELRLHAFGGGPCVGLGLAIYVLEGPQNLVIRFLDALDSFVGSVVRAAAHRMELLQVQLGLTLLGDEEPQPCGRVL